MIATLRKYLSVNVATVILTVITVSFYGADIRKHTWDDPDAFLPTKSLDFKGNVYFASV